MSAKNTQYSIDFSTVLASAVHDMKNSLCLLQQSIEELGKSIAPENTQAAEQLASVHYEASRLNTGLVQLLSLYRAEMGNLPISIDEHYLDDVVDELLATNQSYINHKKIELEVVLQDNLVWYLDADLINLLLNDMLINAMRYCNKKIILSVAEQDGYLVFQVTDDGPGYPSTMLQANTKKMQDFDISQGRTGLGLFFARLIAEAHTNEKRTGSILLANGGILGGSVFTLKLP